MSKLKKIVGEKTLKALIERYFEEIINIITQDYAGGIMMEGKIEGNFVIMKDGKMYIGKRELKNNDKVHLTVKSIKQIILDAKEGLIQPKIFTIA